jgi:hypothetical protein
MIPAVSMARILFLAVLAAVASGPRSIFASQQTNGMVVTLPAPEEAPPQSGSGHFRKLEEPRQDEQKAPSGLAKFKPGPAAATIELQVAEAPERGDTLSAIVTTDALKVVFVLPDGRRISGRKSAEAAGFSWDEIPQAPAMGSSDGGHVTAIDFSKRGASGRYLVEVTARDLKKDEAAQAYFISRKKQYVDEMQHLPGVLLPPAVALAPSGSMAFDLKQDEKAGLLDIVVPDASVQVSLTLPDGRRLRPGEKYGPGIEWKKLARREDIDGPPGRGEIWFSFSGFLLPFEGPHHVISFETAAKGHYEIQAVRTTAGAGELRAIFLPLGRGLDDSRDEIQNGGRLEPDEVRIQPYGPAERGNVGDKLDVNFRIQGDFVPASLRLEVRFELRPFLSSPTPRDDKPPDVGPPQVVPINVTADQTGLYHGSIVLRAAGKARVSIRASGTKASGKPFKDEIVGSDFSVYEPPPPRPLVARFLSLTAKPVDTDGNGKFDRLDVSAVLDVLVPGKYDMDFRIADTGSKDISSFGGADLSKGRQQLTVSISAKEMRHRLKDGPYSVSNVRIFRQKGNFGDDVTIPPREFHTAAFGHDQWEPDPISGDDQATIRGIRPAPSGRFQFAEVEWKVMTPGGDCYWNASLTPAAGGHPADIQGAGKLAAGQSRLSFVFPGADIAVAGSRELLFLPGAHCEGVAGSDFISVKLTVDPAQFEPPASSLRISAQNMLRLRPGGSGLVWVDVPGKQRGDVLFKVTSVPPALSAFLDVGQPDRAAQATIEIEVSPTAPAGRYFIGVAATSAGQTAATEAVVDVTP